MFFFKIFCLYTLLFEICIVESAMRKDGGNKDQMMGKTYELEDICVYKGMKELPDKEKLKTQEKDKITMQVKFLLVIAGGEHQILGLEAVCLTGRESNISETKKAILRMCTHVHKSVEKVNTWKQFTLNGQEIRPFNGVIMR